jgi:trans-aconitate methyltransferase
VSADRRSHWQDVYEHRSPEQVSWYQREPGMSVELIRRAGATKVVDVGGGASVLVDRLLDLGLEVTVLDVAEAALERSRARLGERAADVTWVVADVTEWRPEARFDLWHDRAVFHFLTEAGDRAGYRGALVSALAPGGHAVIATFAPDGPERCSGLPVVRWSAEGLAAELGLELVAREREAHVTPGGSVQPFTWALLRRPPVGA